MYHDLVPSDDIKEKFKPPKIKYPQFFKFAKDKQTNLAEYTGSPMDRIAQIIDNAGNGRYKYAVGDVEFDYKMLMDNTVGNNGKPLYEVNRQDDKYTKLYNILEIRKKSKQVLCREIQKELQQRTMGSKGFKAQFDVFHYYCIKEIKDIFTNKDGEFGINLAVNYLIDMEYRTDFRKSSKDILWKCFGHIIVKNLNDNQRTGITLKERPRMVYKKAIKGDKVLNKQVADKMKRKSVGITQADMNFIGAVLQTKKNGKYYKNDLELLFVLLCHYKYARLSGRLDKDGSFVITKRKHRTGAKSNGKKGQVPIGYNINTIMQIADATSYADSFERFRQSGIDIKEDKEGKKILVKLNVKDDEEDLFIVKDIYNPYLDAYKNKKYLVECVICAKAFIKRSNKKTCSEQCAKTYHNLQVAENNKKIKDRNTAAKVNK